MLDDQAPSVIKPELQALQLRLESVVLHVMNGQGHHHTPVNLSEAPTTSIDFPTSRTQGTVAHPAAVWQQLDTKAGFLLACVALLHNHHDDLTPLIKLKSDDSALLLEAKHLLERSSCGAASQREVSPELGSGQAGADVMLRAGLDPECFAVEEQKKFHSLMKAHASALHQNKQLQPSPMFARSSLLTQHAVNGEPQRHASHTGQGSMPLKVGAKDWSGEAQHSWDTLLHMCLYNI